MVQPETFADKRVFGDTRVGRCPGGGLEDEALGRGDDFQDLVRGTVEGIEEESVGSGVAAERVGWVAARGVCA